MTAAEGQRDTEDGVLPRLIEKLDASDLSNVAQCAVLAAYQGDDDLAQLLDDAASAERVAATAVAARDVPETWLGKITVAGFRGIGPETALTLHPGTGLTLVVGRNGSGKSSFAEAAEVALTGSNARWAGDRGAIWRTGWQNLHRGDVQPSVAVELVVTGRGLTTVTRTWPGDDVTQSEVRVARPGARHER